MTRIGERRHMANTNFCISILSRLVLRVRARTLTLADYPRGFPAARDALAIGARFTPQLADHGPKPTVYRDTVKEPSVDTTLCAEADRYELGLTLRLHSVTGPEG